MTASILSYPTPKRYTKAINVNWWLFSLSIIFIVPLLYGLEIISFALTLFGRGDLVDNTLGGSDLVWVPMSYAPYQPPQPPIIIHETIHHHH